MEIPAQGGGGDDGSSLTFSNMSTSHIVSTVVKFVKDGGRTSDVVVSFIAGIMGSFYLSLGDLIDSAAALASRPFVGAGNAISAVVNDLLRSPTESINSTVSTTGNSINAQFGWLAYPVAVALTLLVLYMIAQYRQQEETGDTIPGIPFDVPFGIGTEEDE